MRSSGRGSVACSLGDASSAFSRPAERGPSNGAGMLPRAMWLFPSLAGLVALVFAALLLQQFARRRRSYQALWAVAMLLYAVASLCVALGAANGWTSGEFRIYWALGAVLNVPFLAQGELDL